MENKGGGDIDEKYLIRGFNTIIHKEVQTMTIDTKEIVTTVAYLIGVRKSALESSYMEDCKEILEKLYAD